jgi:D-serine deaminase-like pyridoxal phosphate-dependent protein
VFSVTRAPGQTLARFFRGWVEFATEAEWQPSFGHRMVTHDMKRILVADTPEAVEILPPVIGDGATLIPAFTVEEALAVAAQGVDMIVAGVHFDKSRMFDLLRMLHADRQLRNTPVVCVRLLGSNLAPRLFEKLDIPCKALGAIDFIDLYALERRFGQEGARAEVARMILAVVHNRALSTRAS